MVGYIGSKAVTLSTTAADVTGDATINGNLTVNGTTVTIDSAAAQEIRLGDNDKMTFGDATGGDLQIYHDGSASRIHDNGTGNLIISATNLQVNNGANNETMLTATSGGAVSLNYAGSSAKLSTTSTGIEIKNSSDPVVKIQRGTGSYSEISADSNGTLFLRADEGNTSSSSNIRFEVDNTEHLRLDEYGQLILQSNPSTFFLGGTSTGSLVKGTSTGNYLIFGTSGAEVARFSGGNLGIGTSSPMVALNVHDSTNARIALTNSSTGQTFPDGFELLATGLDAYVQNRSNGNMVFTTNNTERMLIDSSGRVTMPYQPVFSYLGSHSYSIATTGTQTMSSSNVWAASVNHALNRGSHFNPSTGRFTAPVAGTYHFQFTCTASDFNSGYLWFYMSKNGSAKSYVQASQQTEHTMIVHNFYFDLSANDYVSVQWTNNYVSGKINYPGFSGYLVG